MRTPRSLLIGAFLALSLPAQAAEVVLTQPHCDRCSADDKAWLRPRSALIARTVALIDQARTRVDAAPMAWSAPIWVERVGP